MSYSQGVLRVENECRAPRVEGKRTTTSALFIPCSLRPAFSFDTLSPTLSAYRPSSFLHRSQQRTQIVKNLSVISVASCKNPFLFRLSLWRTLRLCARLIPKQNPQSEFRNPK